MTCGSRSRNEAAVTRANRAVSDLPTSRVAAPSHVGETRCKYAKPFTAPSPNLADRAMQLARILKAPNDKDAAEALFTRATSIMANASDRKSAGAADASDSFNIRCWSL